MGTHKHYAQLPQADVAGLDTTLAGKAATGHTHAVPAPVTLTDAAPIATDAGLGTLFRVAAVGNRTLGVPTNPTDGQRALWEHTASGADRTLTLATGAGGFVGGANVSATLTATIAGKTDFIGAVYRASVNQWRVLAVAKGY